MARVECSHPVLWTEGRRRVEERRIAEEVQNQALQRREQRYVKKLQDREEYKKMIETYDPFGKPGAGAPNSDIRIKNIYLEGLFPEPKENPRTPITPSGRYKFRGTETGGGGAPLRDSSGRIVTPIKEDPMLSFNEANRDHVNSVLRYKTDPIEKTTYKLELDRLMAEHELKKMEENKLLREFMPKTPMLSEYTDTNLQQWGRAGPGGVPWRNPKSKGQNFMKSLGWTNKKVLKEIDKQISGKSSSGDKLRPLNLESPEKKKENLTPCCARCICDCPAKYGKAKTDDVVTFKEKMAYPKPIQTAAPRKSSPLWHGPKKKYRNDAAPCYQVTGGVELVPLLAKRRAASKPVSLSTTDVTKVRDVYTSWREPIGAEYLNELNEQIGRRQKEIEMYRQRDDEISRQHYQTWQSFWGRPGHGAPTGTNKKLNLNALLYRDPFCKNSKHETNIDGY